MAAQTRYITSLLSVFSTFLENLNVSRDLALLTTEKFIVFTTTRTKIDENWTQNWQISELEKFITTQNVPHKSAVLMRKFITNYTPLEVDIYLHEFLTSIKADNRSDSTIKNYRSDIQQFANFAGRSKLQSLFDPQNLRGFVQDQLKNGLQVSTIKRKLSSISQFALWAETEKIVTDASFWISDMESLIAGRASTHSVNSFASPDAPGKSGISGASAPTQNSSGTTKTAAQELEDFLISLEIDTHSDSTIKNYKSDIGQFLEFTTQTDLQKIVSQAEIEKFVISQKKLGLKINSIKRKVSSISQFALWSETRGAIHGISGWIHNLQNQLFEVKPQEASSPATQTHDHKQNFELKLKPATLVHAYDGKPQHTGWSLPVPDFASSSDHDLSNNHGSATTHTSTSNHNHATKIAKENQTVYSGIKANLQEFANQINTKRNKQFLPYLNLVMLFIFAIGLGILGYQQFIVQAPTPFAYPTSPVRPNRELSFQGRLTDTAQNPITSATNMAFRLYDTGPGSGGTQLWSSGTCSATPDQDGIFSVGLGDDCGSEITQDVFTENSNVWLEVQIVSETLTPRQSIKTVAYALNSETVQGYPVSATGAATTNTILTMDAGGQVLLGEVSPKLKSNSGTFAIEAQTLMLQTSAGSNGNITLNPDGTGKVIVQSNLDLEGYLHAPGATFSATYAGGTALIAKGGPSGTANIQEWQNSAGSPLTVMDESGNLGIGTSNPAAKLAVIGNGSIFQQLTDNSDIALFKEYRGGNLARITESGDAGVLEVGYYGMAGPKAVLNGGTSNGAGLLELYNNTPTKTVQLTGNGLSYFNGGNLGVGTTAPNQKLDVYGNIKVEDATGRTIGFATSNGLFYRGMSSETVTSGFALKFKNSASGNSDPYITLGSSAGGVADALLVNVLTGNVGIGTTNPLFKLDVAGTASVNSLNINDAFTFPTADGTNGYVLQTNGSGTVSWASVLTDSPSVGAWSHGNHFLYPDEYWADDLIIGGNSTASAKFQVKATDGSGYFAGNVGIGTTSLTQALSVAGNILSTQALFAGNGYGLYWGDGTTRITGSASTDSITFRTNASDVATINSSGNLGIGTTTPIGKLNIDGAAVGKALSIFNETGDQDIIAASASGVTRFRVSRDGYVYGERFADNSNSAYFLDPAAVTTSALLNGNVGIGTSTANYALDVTGEANFTDAIRAGGDAGSAGYFLTSSAGGVNTWTNPASILSSGYWTNTLNVLHPKNEYASVVDLVIGGTSTASADIQLKANGQAYFGSNVGIGTATPTSGFLLDVRGNLVTGNQGAAALSGNKNLYVNNLTTDTTTTNYNVASSLDVNPGGNTSRIYMGGYYNTDVVAGNAANFTGRLVGLQGQVDFRGTGTVTQVRGVAGIVNSHSTGAITTAYGGYYGIYNNAAGTITNAHSLYVVDGTNAGTVVGKTGLTIAGITNATNTTDVLLGTSTIPAGNFALYSSSSRKSYFGGNVGIGSTDPQYALDVVGALRATRTITSYDNTYTVDRNGGGDFTTIGAAVTQINTNADNSASNPYTLIVMNGTYDEDVTVPNYTSIKGQGYYSTIIDGRMTIGSGSNIENLRISPTGSETIAVLANPSVDTSYLLNTYVLINNDLNAPTYAVSFTGTTDFRIYNTFIYGRNPNAGGSAANYLLRNNGGTGDLEAHVSHLKSSCGNNSNCNLALNDASTAGSDVIVTGSSWSVFNDSSPVGAVNNNASGQIKIEVAYENDSSDYAPYTITGSNVVNAPTQTGPILASLGNGFTSGSALGIQYHDSTTLTGGLTGANIDLTTNVTASNQNITGVNLVIPNSGSGTSKGINLSGAADYGLYLAGETSNYISGNVGIGTTTANYKLDVTGEANFTDAIRAGGDAGTTGYFLTSSSGGVNTWTDPASILSSGYWANTLNVLHPKNEYASVVDLVLGGTSTASADIHLQSNGQAYFGGNVGIGTNTPTSPLLVNFTETTGTNRVISQFRTIPGNGGGSSILRTTATSYSTDIEQNNGGTSPFRFGSTYVDTNIVNNYTDASGPYGNINFVTNGATAMTITGGNIAGKVGIGTMNPTGKLHVTGAVTGKALAILNETGNQAIFVASTSGTNRFIIQNDGNVGIGTGSPSQKLDVAGNAILSGTTPTLYLADTNNYIQNNGSNIIAKTSGSYYFRNTGNTDKLSILSTGDFNFSDNSNGNVFTIKNSGNVGIGSSAPGYNLDVTGEANFTDAIRAGGNAGTTGYFLTSSSGGVNTWTDPASILSSGYWTNTLNVLHPKNEYASIVDLVIGGTSTASADIQLKANGQAYFGGNVGIGSTSPGAKLDIVSGTTYSDIGIQSTGGFKVRGDGRVDVGSASGQNALLSVNRTTGNSVADLAYLGNADGLDMHINSSSTVFSLAVSGATGKLAFGNSALNSQQLVLDTSSGNVGIGTSAPLGKLNVEGAATGKALAILNETGGQAIFAASASGTNRFIIQNDGNVGIGTSAPTAKLDVRGTVQQYVDASTQYRIVQRASGYMGFLGNAVDYFLNFDTASQRVSVGPSNTAPLSRFQVDGNTTIGNGYLGVAAPTNGAIIEGNVGIGTSNPTSNLQIGSSASNWTTIGSGAIDSSWTTDSRFGLYQNGTSQLGLPAANDGGAMFLSSSNGDSIISGGGSGVATLKFWVGGIVDPRMTITNAGNVGIGTMTPGGLLDVGSSSQFRVSSTGDLTKINNVAYTWPASQGAASTALVNNGSGGLSWTAVSGLGTNYWSKVAGVLSPSLAEPVAATSSATTVGTFTAGGTNLALRAGGSTDATTLNVTSAGNVGIGTTTPAPAGFFGGGRMLQLKDATTNLPHISILSSATEFVLGADSNNGYIGTQSNGGVKFYTNATQKAYLSADGNFGIGTTAPTGLLQVSGAAKGKALAILNETGGQAIFAASASGTNRFIIQNDGNVGINTTAPTDGLHVYQKNILADQGNITANRGVVAITEKDNSDQNYRYLSVLQEHWDSAAQTGAMVITVPDTSNTMMTIKISGYNFTSSTGAWEVIASGYWYNTGDAWINTSTEIRGKAPFSRVRLMKNNTGTTPVIVLGETSTTWEYPQINVDVDIAGYIGQNGMATGWSAALSTDISALTADDEPGIAYFWDTSSRLGIGTTAPSYKLDVAGTGRFTGAVDLDADLELSSTLTDINNSVGTSGQILSSTATGVDWIDVSALTGVKWNTIASPDGNQSLAMGAYTSAWTFNTLTTATGMGMSTSSVTTGSVLGLTSTSTAVTTGGLLNISATGAPAGSWTGNVANIEYNNASVNVDGTALKVGLLGAAAGDGTALNVTTAQTGTSAYALRVNDDGTYTDSTPFVIDAAGNVGVGTITPGAKFEILGSVEETIRVNNSGTVGAIHFREGGTLRGMIGYSDAGSIFTDGASDSMRIRAESNLYLGTGTASDMMIDSSGNVGIGTTTASKQLIVGNTAGSTIAISTNGAAGTIVSPKNMDLSFIGYAGGELSRIRSWDESTDTGDSHLTFWTTDYGDDNLAERVRINQDGNLGIGDTTPTYKLDVNGTGRFTGAVDLDGDLELNSTLTDGSNTVGTSGQVLTSAGAGFAPTWTSIGSATITDDSLDFTDFIDAMTLDASTSVAFGTYNYAHNLNSTGDFVIQDNGTPFATFADDGSFSLDNLKLDGNTISSGTGAITLQPTAGQNVNISLQTTGDFAVNTSQFYVDTSTTNVGIGTTAPSSKLAVTGTAEMGGNYGWLSSSFGARISPPGTSVSAAASATTGALALYAGSGEYGIHADGASSKNYFAGNVGIGTTTIPSQLYIRSAVETRAMAFTSSTTDYSEFAAQNSASTGIMMRMYGTATTGTWAGVNVAGASALFSQANGLFIGHPSTTNIPIIFGKSDAEYMRITTNGNVSIGTTATTRKLTVAGTARITTSQAVTDTLTLCTDANGDIEFKSGACSTSSIKYKQNVENLSYGLDSIREMNPVFFEYKDWVGNDLSSRTKRKVGFIAEEMELIIPEVVIKENGEIDGIDYAFLTSVLANGIKQLDTRVESIFINFVASTASITDLTVQSLQIGGRTIEDYIVSIINNQSTGNSNELVSPLAGELIADSLVTNTLNTENLTATGSSTLGNLLVADISITNDVSVGGELTAESLLVNADASVSGSLLAGLVNADALTTQNATVSGTLEAGTLIANHIDATSTRISALEAGIAQLEHVRATTADIVNATVSGTLYADNIYDFENKVATTLQRPGLLDILLGTDESTTSATFMQDLYDIVNTTEFNASTSADLNLSFSELSMTNDDVALTGTALFIEKYLKVNGSGYISDSLAVGNKLFIGETMQIADGLIRYTTTDPTNQILQIQPEGQGSVELLAGIVIIDDSGKVAVNGDLEVTGSAKVASLLTNMLKPADFGNPLQVQVAGVDTQTNEVKKSRFEIINEVGTPVATFSAEGNAEFAGKAEFGGGIGVTSQVLGSSESNELTTDKTSGKATIKSGASDVTIKSNLITNESLVYVTAVGSTGNQVIYVKAQTADDTNTPEQEGKFVVGFDNLTSTDVSFNWWIVN